MQIKRTLTFCDEVASEAGQAVDPPLRKVAVAAIIDNPYAGRFERDLGPAGAPGVDVVGGEPQLGGDVGDGTHAPG